MGYDFSNLSHLDFEDLARDIVGEDLGVRFEAFAAGPDGGIDGRHSSADGDIILQAKHYLGSKFSDLKKVMKAESVAVRTLPLARYILFTSFNLTDKQKDELVAVVDLPGMKKGDIYGLQDIRGRLRKYPAVAKAHIKLWLSDTAILERIVHASHAAYTETTKAEIEQKVKLYATNTSFSKSVEILELSHILIISGVGGVGKTTLASMLSYAYMGQGWEFVAIRSLDDGFASIKDDRKQIFLFDDFLGRVGLDRNALANKDSELAKFIFRVRNSPNARFILTTRSPILEEARRISEYINDPRLDISKFLLDVSVYTRPIKARILFNHLFFQNVNAIYIEQLICQGTLKKIVDHRNYNPRIVEAMTDAISLSQIIPKEYPAKFLEILDNPRLIWEASFRSHITNESRHLIYVIYFSSEYGVEISRLRPLFESVHKFLCDKYNLSRSPQDFENAIMFLENGYIKISGTEISFINPSVRDFLKSHLDDIQFLSSLISASINVNFATTIFDKIKVMTTDQNSIRQAILCFLPILTVIETSPVWRKDSKNPSAMRINDAYNTSRIELLLFLHSTTGRTEFYRSALKIATSPCDRFSAWLDGRSLVNLIASHYRDGVSGGVTNELCTQLELRLIEIFPYESLELLDSLHEEIVDHEKHIPKKIKEACQIEIRDTILNASLNMRNIESHSEVESDVSIIKKYSRILSISNETSERTLALYAERAEELDASADDNSGPSLPRPRLADVGKGEFDDKALEEMFQPLLIPRL